jgi:hypothetical protein
MSMIIYWINLQVTEVQPIADILTCLSRFL